MYRSEYLVISGDEKTKTSFVFPDSSLVGYDTVSNCKSDFPQRNIAYIFRI